MARPNPDGEYEISVAPTVDEAVEYEYEDSIITEVPSTAPIGDEQTGVPTTGDVVTNSPSTDSPTAVPTQIPTNAITESPSIAPTADGPAFSLSPTSSPFEISSAENDNSQSAAIGGAAAGVLLFVVAALGAYKWITRKEKPSNELENSEITTKGEKGLGGVV